MFCLSSNTKQTSSFLSTFMFTIYYIKNRGGFHIVCTLLHSKYVKRIPGTSQCIQIKKKKS